MFKGNEVDKGQTMTVVYNLFRLVLFLVAAVEVKISKQNSSLRIGVAYMTFISTSKCFCLSVKKVSTCSVKLTCVQILPSFYD